MLLAITLALHYFILIELSSLFLSLVAKAKDPTQSGGQGGKRQDRAEQISYSVDCDMIITAKWDLAFN